MVGFHAGLILLMGRVVDKCKRKIFVMASLSANWMKSIHIVEARQEWDAGLKVRVPGLLCRTRQTVCLIR
ncbi:MAG: hypothetical protein B7Y56_12245 [Gallionellales bacterium 35-53-114]|nr:MAG: hypothetical protein B7Y56_12245 [Gallionellales bacterium 35-53-114]